MINRKKILVLISFTLSVICFGAPPCPGCTDPGTGGAGGTTPGAPASPIDMYIYILIIFAFIATGYFAKKYKVQKI